MLCSPGLRRGLTLIEVAASLALLGALLASALLSGARHRRQMESAQLRLEAVAHADQMLQTWFYNNSSQGPPLNASGETPALEEGRSFHWRTSQIPSPETESAGVAAVRLELFPLDDRTATQPLAVVEFFIPRSAPPVVLP